MPRRSNEWLRMPSTALCKAELSMQQTLEPALNPSPQRCEGEGLPAGLAQRSLASTKGTLLLLRLDNYVASRTLILVCSRTVSTACTAMLVYVCVYCLNAMHTLVCLLYTRYTNPPSHVYV